MKTFSIHTVRNVFAVAVVIGLGYMVYLANPSSVGAPKVEAGTSQNISGFAWSQGTKMGAEAANPPSGPFSTTVGSSSGIGWISFNSTSDGSPFSYGVNISTANKATGGTNTFTGRAWSENIGWIDFAEGSLVGCPSAPCKAEINWTTGKVTGWAHAYNGSATSGWDGWIKLSGTADDGSTYGVSLGTVSANNFSGYAWGSDVIGWINFAPTVNGVPVGVKLAGASCTEAAVTSSGTWGTCVPSRACTALEAGTTVTVDGIRTGLCSEADGGGETTAFCDNAVLVCPAAVAPSTGKKRFWQF